MNMIERSIPQHTKGIRKRYSAVRKFVSVEDAHLCYDHAITRLLNINHWDTISTAGKGMFQVMNGKLKLQRRKVKLGDYVRIGLPAPDNEDGAGYDWVQVKTLKFSSGKRKEQCVLTMMPCPVPGSDNTTTAHFFSGESSSTFLLTRDSRLVTAEYYGHNEVPNTATSGIGETVRNMAVASGAILGLSDTLWEPLTKGLLMDGTVLRDLQVQTVNS
jgi:hypothetical protein